MGRNDDADFAEFVRSRAGVMRRTAYLLCGDWDRADDLVQTTLVKVYRAWPRLRRSDTLDAYCRQVLVRTSVDGHRRARARPRVSGIAVPDVAVAPSDVEDALDVRDALTALPAGQRAVVVLRYWEDLSVAETARLLHCSEGTVKSQAAKGIAALRSRIAHPLAITERR